jgi:hypothetical protein
VYRGGAALATEGVNQVLFLEQRQDLIGIEIDPFEGQAAFPILNHHSL